MVLKVLNRGPGRKAFVLFTLSILLLSIWLIGEKVVDEPVIGEADAVRPVTAYITLDPQGTDQKGNTVELNTGPAANTLTTMKANVTLYRSEKVLRTKVLFELYFASDDVNIVTGSVFPRLYELGPNMLKQESFEFVVNIQLASPMINYSTGIHPPIRIRVWGEWSAVYEVGAVDRWDNGPIPETPIYVNIKPYYYLQMSYDPPMLQLSPGGSGTVKVIVMNTGNGYERVDLEILNEASYAREGWAFEFQRTSLTIPPRSEAEAEIKVTSPRKFSLQLHMEMKDFPVKATSYYSKYQVAEGDIAEEVTYEMPFFVYVTGIDFVFVPAAWAVIMYIALFLVLFNFGIRIWSMRRRKLPKGKRPGFLALKHRIASPERKEIRKAMRDERREVRKKEDERKRMEQAAVKERTPESGPPPRAAPLLPTAPSRKVIDLTPRKEDDDFDIDVPETGGRGEGRKDLPAPPPPPQRKKKREEFEKDVIDVLGSLDD